MKPILRLLAVGAFLFAVPAVHAAQAEISGIDKIDLRSGPSAHEPAIAILSAGDAVDIIDIEGSWTKVQTGDGKIGYVYHRYVVPKVATEGTAPPEAAPVAAVTHAPIAAAPLRTPAIAAPAVAASAVERSPSGELSTELATLRAEIAELKEKVQERQAELANAPESSPAPVATDGFSTPIGPATTPPAAPISGRDQAVGVLMIAAFSLVIGWVLGATFGRRGSRSRGGRLRF